MLRVLPLVGIKVNAGSPAMRRWTVKSLFVNELQLYSWAHICALGWYVQYVREQQDHGYRSWGELSLPQFSASMTPKSATCGGGPTPYNGKKSKWKDIRVGKEFNFDYFNKNNNLNWLFLFPNHVCVCVCVFATHCVCASKLLPWRSPTSLSWWAQL